ncbi:hypothetical protein [Sinorhizobium fredii]|uniref:hypothetical protein n=1 Tax=Rhizobium fredii TaxID=380 RepID=UPI001FCCA372|nr:hypothetical protein [Sinorhizobium fredii]
MKPSEEATFGPVAPLFRFVTEEEVMSAQTVQSLDGVLRLLARYLEDIRGAEALESGMVEPLRCRQASLRSHLSVSSWPYHGLGRLTYSSACPDPL